MDIMNVENDAVLTDADWANIKAIRARALAKIAENKAAKTQAEQAEFNKLVAKLQRPDVKYKNTTLAKMPLNIARIRIGDVFDDGGELHVVIKIATAALMDCSIEYQVELRSERSSGRTITCYRAADATKWSSMS